MNTNDSTYEWNWHCGYFVGFAKKRQGVYWTYQVENERHELVAAGRTLFKGSMWPKAYKAIQGVHYG